MTRSGEVCIGASQDVTWQIVLLDYLLHRAGLTEGLQVGLVQDSFRLGILVGRARSQKIAHAMVVRSGLLISDGCRASTIVVGPLSNRCINEFLEAESLRGETVDATAAAKELAEIN